MGGGGRVYDGVDERCDWLLVEDHHHLVPVPYIEVWQLGVNHMSGGVEPVKPTRGILTISVNFCEKFYHVFDVKAVYNNMLYQFNGENKCGI
ncbi:hypothetical protein Hamer_G019555 [Homarus americanus]|uniref:Uncharacterized protein n=1 Tax=Homarus americanus TaxID=6706 RepID=A0A8J5JFB6_HOMAM|nr:hypothetical protein Hamer_G019555 [Homarus americanus]